MATPSGDSVFVDTNVLVYATIAESPFHEAARMKLHELQTSGKVLCASNQVLREYLACLTRPGFFPEPPARDEVLDCVEELRERYTILPDDSLVATRLIRLLREIDCSGRQVHDANIVATMLTANVTTLLTENLKDFRRFETYVSLLRLPPPGES